MLASFNEHCATEMGQEARLAFPAPVQSAIVRRLFGQQNGSEVVGRRSVAVSFRTDTSVREVDCGLSYLFLKRESISSLHPPRASISDTCAAVIVTRLCRERERGKQRPFGHSDPSSGTSTAPLFPLPVSSQAMAP
jgi:hypothetical protein